MTSEKKPIDNKKNDWIVVPWQVELETWNQESHGAKGEGNINSKSLLLEKHGISSKSRFDDCSAPSQHVHSTMHSTLDCFELNASIYATYWVRRLVVLLWSATCKHPTVASILFWFSLEHPVRDLTHTRKHHRKGLFIKGSKLLQDTIITIIIYSSSYRVLTPILYHLTHPTSYSANQQGAELTNAATEDPIV